VTATHAADPVTAGFGLHVVKFRLKP